MPEVRAADGGHRGRADDGGLAVPLRVLPPASEFLDPAANMRRGLGLVALLFILGVGQVVIGLSYPVGARATLAKAQADVQTLASAVDRYQAHMGAPPATLAELTSPATNARGQTAEPYLSHIPSPSPGFSDYRYERRADGHWTITTTGRDYCDRPQRIEATSGSSVTPTEFVNCPGQFWWRLLFSAQLGPRNPFHPTPSGSFPLVAAVFEEYL
jgi:hypothetical protein